MAEEPWTPVLIGAIHDKGAAGGVFNGAIDEVRIWSVDRSQQEIAAGMNRRASAHSRASARSPQPKPTRPWNLLVPASFAIF